MKARQLKRQRKNRYNSCCGPNDKNVAITLMAHAHFPNGITEKTSCSDCSDYKNLDCPGQSLKGFDVIDCMADGVKVFGGYWR